MMNNSVWPDTAKLPAFGRLERNLKTDVLIIGGGLAGILCAYMLSKAGVDYALVEADRIFHGVSRNTTAKITAQHGLICSKLLREFGEARARMYLDANQEALAQYRQLSKTIQYDFEEKDCYVYSVDRPSKLEQEMDAMERIGFQAEFVKDLSLPIQTAGAVKVKAQAQCNPLKLGAEVARGLRIYEHTPVRAFDERGFLTDRGRITAEKTIVATHFPIFNKHGGYFLKLYQHRSYVLALENAMSGALDGMYVDERDTGLSFRSYGELLLLGGGGHRTGKKGGGWKELAAFTQTHYPKAGVRYHWATQDCMSLDGVPYIGQYGKNTPGLYVASGFNKWGLTSSMVAAMLLRDLVLGRENPWADVFSPSRTVLRPQLACNALESALNLIAPSVPRCPHMGCALKWNEQERSWDCPCHGSRFTEQGKLMDNPAEGDLKK